MPLDPPSPRYRHHDETDVVTLVCNHPFAWVVSSHQQLSATPLPLRPVLDDDGHLVALRGHFARANPQVERLRAEPRAQLLFMGPHGYVSPSWLEDRTQAPTWNYACAVFDCDLIWTDDDSQTESLLRDLVDAMEQDRPNAWQLDDMGARYHRLAQGVIGFRADIRDRRVVFKLGQDESADQFPQILAGLDADGQTELTAWMRRHRT